MESNPVSAYLADVTAAWRSGKAREHTHRPALQHLIKSIDPKLGVLNEPERSQHGAPDFVFLRGELTVGYAETKDLGADLDKVEKSEQLERYLGYSNLVLTDYLEFRFFRNGARYGESVTIAKIEGGNIIPIPEAHTELVDTLKDFLEAKPEQIKSGSRLAKIMGGKARRIRENVARFIVDESERGSELRAIYSIIKKLLVHDMTPEQFADMYAQTLVYGLFVARFHDETPDNFSRKEARDLVPPSNPFLQHFFDHIVGPEFDSRLAYIVNELCEVFAVADVKKIMEKYYEELSANKKSKETPDPVIHFYEDFLKEYDAAQRVKLGAFYTPIAVVRFIVQAVNNILVRDFALSGGLADTARIERDVVVQGKKTKESIHKVQILDLAVGTGTFLNEVVKTIHATFKGQEGRWQSYVDRDLLPRLHGFELMMAPYTIAHLKLGMTFRETGYEKFSKRLGIYLTNSLEEAHDDDGSLFGVGMMKSITTEALEASDIKNKKPIMVVLGNPPYSVSSSNKGKWIQDLIAAYKKDLNEKKINLDDDYIKFIRFAEHFVEKNGEGIVAMITNNSYIDGVTHRQMRKHLLETFDDIYVLDLHGNSKKKEVAPDGGKDENVFDIQQGVSIAIFVRKAGKKKGLGVVHHAELWGKREEKYDALEKGTLVSINWKKLDYKEPYFFFVPKDFGQHDEYERGFKLDELFPIYNSGVKTDRDELFVDIDKNSLEKRISVLLSGDYDEAFIKKYRVVDSGSYKILAKIKNRHFDESKVTKIQYRPLDYRWQYYDPQLISRPADKVFRHVNHKENLCILTCRQQSTFNFQHILMTTQLADICTVSLQTKETGYVFPAYLYADDGTKVPNLNKEILEKIKENLTGDVAPEDIFDYIYAVLHSPTYREKYKEFLKIDFPRVSYPKDNETFWKLVEKGRELRALHLMESPVLSQFITTFSVKGDGMVEKPDYKDGKVYINKTQYFGGVPEVAWNFYIGGYQPAQKWLKDRKGRVLSNDDLTHYQKIIIALTETARIMGEIDMISLIP